MNKTHIALNVTNLDAAVTFYRQFLQAEPSKLRLGYANFDLDDPPLKLALNQARRGGVSHLGVQLTDGADVIAEIERLSAAGFDTLSEMDTGCCHSVQDKVWISDPDGHRWELFVVKRDGPSAGQASAPCCGCDCGGRVS